MVRGEGRGVRKSAIYIYNFGTSKNMKPKPLPTSGGTLLGTQLWWKWARSTLWSSVGGHPIYKLKKS